MKRVCVILVVLAAVAACKGKAAAKDKSKPAVPEETPVDRPAVVIDGPSVAPVITQSITFFVPKEAPWWGEMSFACYSAAIRLQPGNSPAATFTKISPNIEPALRAADIDLDQDLGAIGVWGCGEGPCVYIALALRQPDKLGGLLGRLVPGELPKTVGKHHYTVAAPGAQGPRTIHLQAVPIAWPDKVPTDIWSRQAARATHLVFITGLFGKTTEVDPLAAMADAATATAKVADVEGVITDARGRCIAGAVSKREFQPGHQLDRARFVLAAPEGKGDPLTRLLGSNRTLDLEAELVLTPAPTEKVVQAWIAQARQFLGATVDGVRAQFAGQGAIIDVMFELAALLGNRGFRHTLKDKSVLLSFRTDRVTDAELAAVETRMQAAMKDLGVTP